MFAEQTPGSILHAFFLPHLPMSIRFPIPEKYTSKYLSSVSLFQHICLSFSWKMILSSLSNSDQTILIHSSNPFLCSYQSAISNANSKFPFNNLFQITQVFQEDFACPFNLSSFYSIFFSFLGSIFFFFFFTISHILICAIPQWEKKTFQVSNK